MILFGWFGARPHRALFVAISAVVWFVLSVGSAQADSAVPTNYKSSVLDVEPDSTVADFAVVGGDGFLEITVAAGHTALIPGYFDDPYIRIDQDGTVWVNHDSPAYFINQDRYGRVQAPAAADGRGEPQWERVAGGGSYAWQDHRIHWMSFDLPPVVSGDHYQFVFPWDVPIEVDGRELSVRGELVYVPSRSPYPALLAGLVGLLPLVGRRSRDTVPVTLFGIVAGAVAVLATGMQLSGTPPPVRTFPVAAAAPLLAVVLALIALVLRRMSVARWLSLLCGLLLAVWAVANLGTLWLPVLPSSSWSDLQRVATSFVLWSGVAVAGASVAASLAALADRRSRIA